MKIRIMLLHSLSYSLLITSCGNSVLKNKNKTIPTKEESTDKTVESEDGKAQKPEVKKEIAQKNHKTLIIQQKMNFLL